MPLFSSSSLPPGCADCVMTLIPAGGLTQVSPWKMFRAGDGGTRYDFGAISLINRPGGLSFLLDHLAMQFRTLSMAPPAMGMGMPGFGLPGMPAMGGPAAPGSMQELGKMLIEGIMAFGLRYAMPGGQMEMWTSTKLLLPVLMTMTGAFGQQTCRCANIAGEPNPSMFQIPPGYTQITPPPRPSVPNAPNLPNLPR